MGDARPTGRDRRGDGGDPERRTYARGLPLVVRIWAGFGLLVTGGPFVAMAAGMSFELGPNPGLVLALFATAALAFLAVQAFRRGTDIDRRDGRLIHWWGFVVPWRARETALGDVTAVRATLAPLPLLPSSVEVQVGGRPRVLARFASAARASAAAADLVGFLGVAGSVRAFDGERAIDQADVPAAPGSDARSSARGGPARDRWERVSGGRDAVGFRLVSAAMGLAFATGPFWFFGPREGSRWPDPVFIVFCAVGGAAFAAFGLFASRIGVHRVTLDRTTGIATRDAAGLPGMAWAGRVRLADFARVTLGTERRGGGRNSAEYTAYVVGLGGDRAEPFELVAHRSLDAARRDAESAAKWLGLPLHDVSGGAEVVRPAATLDESLAARARRTGERPPSPRPKPGWRLRVEAARRGTTIRIPALGMGPVHVGGVLAALAVAACLGWFAVVPGAGALFALAVSFPPEGFHPIRLIVGFAGLAITVACVEGVWWLVRHRMLVERMEVGTEGLAVQWRHGPLWRSRWLPAATIEEVELAVRPKGFGQRAAENVVRIWSDAGRIEVGLTLDPAERAWLCAALRHHLSG